MKTLIVTIAFFMSFSAQAKTLEERNEELTVLRQKVVSALAQGKRERACFLSGQFHSKMSEVLEIVKTQIGDNENTRGMERLLPELEDQCRN